MKKNQTNQKNAPANLNNLLTEVADGNLSALVLQVKRSPEVMAPLCEALADQVSLAGKGDEAVSTHALNALEALAKQLMTVAEAHLVVQLGVMLGGAGSASPPVRAAGEAAVEAVMSSMSAHAVRQVLPFLFRAAASGQAVQTRILALKCIGALAQHAPRQLSFAMPEVVPHLTLSMGDAKKEVKLAALEALVSACDVVGNKDIEHMTPHIVRCIINPEQVPEILHELAGVTFVQSVTSAALAMVVPLLLRGLRSPKTATRRQSCVIMDNMSKLVDDPIDAQPFLPTLLPALLGAADAMSDPEARKVAEDASKQMSRLSIECDAYKLGCQAADPAAVALALSTLAAPVIMDPKVLDHLSHICCSLMTLKMFEAADWEEELTKYLVACVGEKKVAEAVVAKLRPACKEMVKFTPPADSDDGDSAKELLCDCVFTLAYGTKTLLHNATMRLKRGHKYGLLGNNDSGKTTLMRAIANGSVAGFPDPSLVRTVFVEADIQGELSHLTCVEYIMMDERLRGMDRAEILAVMASVGFTESGKAKPLDVVSTLSGGWRMKLALARAMLQNAEILLLDEPTNHLDVINVAWVKNYINSLTEVTCIMVSHNTAFLNDCCSDILHIERLKLKSYRGNLDSFLALNPDSRAFFSIRECKLKFKFPQPGPIEGVKSRSKCLMKMQHCDFTYPGNATPTLFDISVQVSMASRVGCVGENGAGKSTMIKVLTGEVVPQTGETWRHPNARVAYVAQHAFHHLEQHLQMTPNEYIRWRYANGEDKESLVKVSMIATEEELVLQREPFEVQWKDDEGKVVKKNKVVLELQGSRRENKQKEYEYEVKFRDGSEGHLSVKVFERRGWGKACKIIDARIAQRSGLYIRTLSSANVEKHLGDCGLEPEFSTHHRMSALSGGQKVKVVMAASMWNQVTSKWPNDSDPSIPDLP